MFTTGTGCKRACASGDRKGIFSCQPRARQTPLPLLIIPFWPGSHRDWGRGEDNSTPAGQRTSLQDRTFHPKRCGKDEEPHCAISTMATLSPQSPLISFACEVEQKFPKNSCDEEMPPVSVENMCVCVSVYTCVSLPVYCSTARLMNRPSDKRAV